jgi:K+-sensing histidine kinase KdpD
LVVGYLLVIVLSSLRFSLRLVWFATLASMAGYIFLLGYARWFVDPDRNLRVPRYQQAIFLLALALTGIVLGQVIRRVKKMAEQFALRTKEKTP